MHNSDTIPHILKYMGGKREILNDIDSAIANMEVATDTFCDLFAGTSIVAFAFSDKYNIISNDIQQYSSIFAQTYLTDYSTILDIATIVDEICKEAAELVKEVDERYPDFKFEYKEEISFAEMQLMEDEQMSLITKEFDDGFSFFKKSYSGTYWSYEQCKWIDAIRCVAEHRSNTTLYPAILSSLIYAMSYCTQSTGHFAQYRTLSAKNYKSVLQYRLKSVSDLFRKKLTELLATVPQCTHEHRTSTLDYVDCIETLPEGSLVYADPPYSAVHYSRFYHVLETLVKYDNPKLEYKGRYRDDRYQSPFDQNSNVRTAFKRLFRAIDEKKCHLLLSYSDNALLPQDEVMAIAQECFLDRYTIVTHTKPYTHMKMGRSDEYKMEVHELLISFKRK